MRKTLIVAAVAVAAMAAPALAEDWDFVLINSTGKLIKTVEISPAGAAKWQANKVEEDMAKSDGIKVGARMTLHFDKPESQCRFDVKGTFDDGSSAVWSNINVCDNAYVTLKYANGAPTFTAN